MRDGTGMFALVSLPRCATRWLIERALPKFPDTLVPKAIHGVVTPEMVIDEVERSNAKHVALIGGGILHNQFARLHERWPQMRWGMLVRDPADNVRSMVAKHREGNSMLGVKFPSPLRDDILALRLANLATKRIGRFVQRVLAAAVPVTIWAYPQYTTPEGLFKLALWAGLDPTGAEIAAAESPFNASKLDVLMSSHLREEIRRVFQHPATRQCYQRFRGSR